MSGRRVLIAKAGLDRHDRGALIVARALRAAGYEVIYLPAGRLPEEIARVAVEEDVGAIGLSLLSGAHLRVFRELREALDREGADDVALLAGGTIPTGDVPALKALGVVEVFGPGTHTETIVRSFDHAMQRGEGP